MAIEEEPAPGIPEWVVTFGDMMSLLLTFFIMLVSLSEIKQEEIYQAMVESMRRQFGHETSDASLSPGNTKARTAKLAKLASMGRSERAMLARGGDKVKAPVGDHPRVRMIRQGSRSIFGTVIHFEPQVSELSEANRKDLKLEAGEIAGKAQKIEIRGHTSRNPATGHQDNWELAYARARKTMEYLVSPSVGIKPHRIRITVAGEYEPVGSNHELSDTKRENRVEIFLLDELSQDPNKKSEPTDESTNITDST